MIHGVNGLDVHILEAGYESPGRPLALLLHGFPSSSYDWRLLLEEERGAVTGLEADADPGHRQVVRLTSVVASTDAVYDQPVVEVGWAAEDALRFRLCVSAMIADDGCAHTQQPLCERAPVGDKR